MPVGAGESECAHLVRFYSGSADILPASEAMKGDGVLLGPRSEETARCPSAIKICYSSLEFPNHPGIKSMHGLQESPTVVPRSRALIWVIMKNHSIRARVLN